MTTALPSPSGSDRYHRQQLLPGIGAGGQERLRGAHALIVGCGALGCAIADTLARAGVGTLTIVDRDVVELTNLQRQVLFDEEDATTGLPKAVAAKRRLARINSGIEVRAAVEDFGPDNAEDLSADASVILDGLDNFETRYLLNDLAVHRGIPYFYGGGVGTTGAALTILPHPRHRAPKGKETGGGGATWAPSPCLRCLFPSPPPPGSMPTCETAGVLAPVIQIVTARQATEAIKFITGHLDALDRTMLNVDIWRNTIARLDVNAARSDDCPCCGHGRFDYLDGDSRSRARALCGRRAVQIAPRQAGTRIDLSEIAARLVAHGEFSCTEHLLRGTFQRECTPAGEPVELTLFPNGRAIIRPSEEVEFARSVYARYVGS